MTVELLVLDADGTIYHYPYGDFGSAWDALAASQGLGRKCNALLRKYYNQGEEFYSQWIKEQAALLRGRSIARSENFLFPIPYSQGIENLCRTTKEKGMERGVLTTGIDLVAERAGEELDLDFVVCNVLEREDGKFTGKVRNNVPLWKKHEKLRELCEERGIPLSQTAYIGDNENCIPCLELVRKAGGLAISFEPKTIETAYASHTAIYDLRGAIPWLLAWDPSAAAIFASSRGEYVKNRGKR